MLSVKLGRQWFQWIGEERFLISLPSLSLPPLSLISVLISVTISSCPTPRTLSTPSYRLTQIQQCAFSSPLHVGAPVCMCELCTLSPLSPLCVDRLPCELQMGFTNTYQEWLSASYRVKNNIAGAKNRPFRKPFEMHGVSAASSISPLLSAIYLPPRAAHVLWHGGGLLSSLAFCKLFMKPHRSVQKVSSPTQPQHKAFWDFFWNISLPPKQDGSEMFGQSSTSPYFHFLKKTRPNPIFQSLAQSHFSF